MQGLGSGRPAPSRFSGAQSMVETSALSAGFVERLQNYESAVEVAMPLSPLEAVADDIYVARWMKLVAGDERLEIREASINGFRGDKPVPGALVETINLSTIDKLKTQVNETDEREFQLELSAGKSALVRHGTVRDLHNVRSNASSSESGRQGGTSPRRSEMSGRPTGRILRIRAPSKLVVDHWKFSIMTAIVSSAKRKADEHAAAQHAASGGLGLGGLTSAGSGTNLHAYAGLASSVVAGNALQTRGVPAQGIASGRQASARGVVVGSLQPGLGLGVPGGSLVAQHHLMRMHSGGSAGHGLNALASLPDSDAVSQSSSDRGALSGYPEEGSEGEESPLPGGSSTGGRGGQQRMRGGVAASPATRRGFGAASTHSPANGREAAGFPPSSGGGGPSLHACSSAPSGLAVGAQPLPQGQGGGSRLQGRGSLQEESGSEDSSEDEELLALVQARSRGRTAGSQGGEEAEEDSDEDILGARVGTMSPKAAQAKMKQQEAAHALCAEAASQGRIAGRRNSVDAARAVPPIAPSLTQVVGTGTVDSPMPIEGVGTAAVTATGQEAPAGGAVGSASAGAAATGGLSALGSGSSSSGAWKPRFLRQGQLQPTPVVSSDTNSPVPSIGGESDTASPAVRPSAAELSGGARPPGYPSRSLWSGEGDAQYGVWAAQGHRTAMEDVYSVVQDLQPASGSIEDSDPSSLPTRYYGLFDGHYTGYTAQLAGQRLHGFLAAHPTFTAEPGLTASGTSKQEACSRAPGLRPVLVPDDVCGLAAAVHASFFRVEESLLEDIASGRTGQRQLPGESRPKLDQESGTTALVCCLRGSQLVVGFAGDCRAVLATMAHPDKVGRLSTKDRVYQAVELTHDHSAVSEKVRIEAAGASVHSEVEVKMSRLRDIPRQSPDLLDDPWVKELLEHPSKGDRVTSRVYDIGVSRSIGDLAYKGDGMRSNLDFGDKRLTFKADLVLTSPEVVVREVPRTTGTQGTSTGPGTAPQAFLVLACDGLWEVMSSEEACERVGKYMWERAMDRGRGALAAAAYTAPGDPLGPEGDCMVAARRLVHLAFRLGSQDNITALVVRL